MTTRDGELAGGGNREFKDLGVLKFLICDRKQVSVTLGGRGAEGPQVRALIWAPRVN